MRAVEVQQLLENKNILLLQACEQGFPLNQFEMVSSWFSYLNQGAIFKKMIDLFKQAYGQKQDIDVILVLGALKNGLYSRDEEVTQKCL